ncbi:MAG: M16 family metallopeptidase [Magnetovibrionaceae bacterium]
MPQAAKTVRNWTAGLLAVAALSLGVSAEAASGTGKGVFNPETFTLENGLQVVVVSNHRAPVVNHMVWYRVGGADDPLGRSGLSHYLEHLMFKGTKNLKPGEFSATMARNGARENAFTSRDATAYHQTIAKDRLGVAMRLEAERMRNLVFDPEEYEPEREVVLEERRSRVGNNPQAKLGEQTAAVLHMNHPYRKPIIGWEHEIKAINGDDLRAFYQAHYGPNNAVLLLSGDITAEEARPLVEKYYGPVPRNEAIQPRKRAREPMATADRRVELKDPRVRQPSWARHFLVASYTEGETDLSYPLQVLSFVLSGGQTNPMYRSLVIDQGIAISAGGYYDANVLGPGQFTFYGTPKPGVAIEDLEGAFNAEIDRLVAEGLSQEMVDRAKRNMQAQAIFARDSISGGARSLGGSLIIGRSIEDVENWPDRIGAVTLEEVNNALKKSFQGRASVISQLLPGETG